MRTMDNGSSRLYIDETFKVRHELSNTVLILWGVAAPIPKNIRGSDAAAKEATIEMVKRHNAYSCLVEAVGDLLMELEVRELFSSSAYKKANELLLTLNA